MSDSIIAAIITGVLAVVASILTFFLGLLHNKSKIKKLEKLSNNAYITFLTSDNELNYYLTKANFIYMYTVNCYELYNKLNTILEQNSEIIIKKLVIMVRKKENEKKSDLDTLDTIALQWRNWFNKKRIKEIKMISYDHDPDHYYTIIGDKVVFAGQVFFDDSRPTGTSINYSPILFTDNSKDGGKVIENYTKHFENVLYKYKNNVLLHLV